MLDTAQFPYPGSTALCGAELVRIHQHLAGGMAVVMGERTRRVPIADLAPPPAKTLFHRWLDENVMPGPGGAFTPASDVAQAYRDWLATQTGDAIYPTSDYVFIKMMAAAGHKVTRGLWRAEGERHLRTRVLFPFALRRG